MFRCAIRPRFRAVHIGFVVLGGMAVSACGSGGGSDAPVSVASIASTVMEAVGLTSSDDRKAQKKDDAARLAKQATFGATPALISHIVELGIDGWIEEQFAATGSTYADIAGGAVVVGSCGTDNVCYRNKFTREPVAMRFYSDALSQPDQLRQRVAFALSQIIVASDVEVAHAAGLAALNQIFLTNAFGNYRDILLQATLNGYMGDYLDMADSNKSAPSENYAREMLQLFSMGPDRLNIDGTPVRDATGATVPNYGQDDIRGVARALTGWTYGRINNGSTSDSTLRDWSKPMVPIAARYDTTAKTFLGVTVPANAAQVDSVAAAVDAAFNNSSTPPFISRQLIQQLIMANPSPAYVGRVAAVFVNNGSNVRGDLKAVVRAILTDPEARAVASGDPYGKVREPVLLMTALARAIGMTSDGYVFTMRDQGLGQAVFRSPSVFNFYPPDYPLPGSTTMVSPASKLLTTGNTVARHNFVYDWTIGALTTRSEFAVNASVTGSTGSALDWSAWEALGTDTDAMIDRIDLILLNRQITADQRSRLKAAATAITNTDPATQARARAQAMLYIVASSPLFQVDR